MGMAHQGGMRSPRFALIQERFQTPGGTREEEGLDSGRHSSTIASGLRDVMGRSGHREVGSSGHRGLRHIDCGSSEYGKGKIVKSRSVGPTGYLVPVGPMAR